MPRYFFHIKSDDDFVEDPEGVELRGDVEARQEAIDAAREILAERVLKGDVIDGHVFEVCDANGTKLFRFRSVTCSTSIDVRKRPAMELEDNRLLALAGPALKGIADAFEAVPLLQGQPIHEPMEPITRLYFLTAGMSSEIAMDSGGQRIEVGCVGYEGFAGVPAVLGVDCSPHRSFMETDGYAYVIDAQTMTVAARENALLMSVLHRYAHVFMMQIAATALADGRYNIEQRTARWLLMAHDRLAGDELPLTHDFLALMLGVRRSSVTNALHIVEGSGAIKATRSLINVRDRDALQRLAGASYGLPEREYRRVLG